MDPVLTVPIRGKVLVWAADFGHRSEQMEPAQLRADSLDEPITVLLYRSLRHARGWFLTNANDEMEQRVAEAAGLAGPSVRSCGSK